MNHILKVKLYWKPRKTDELILALRRALYWMKFKITKLSCTSKTVEVTQQLFSKSQSASTTGISGLTSSEGKYTAHKDTRVAKKPNQRT
ncbi:hypothetical protein ACJMK2_024959 [Sinanodonta woodiana]|uniref:Uncharacterized protein n=1 Tax=Sinanodonta woodiana TaxID=1069815 RepID=A0ABD3XIQ7_SINWO